MSVPAKSVLVCSATLFVVALVYLYAALQIPVEEANPGIGPAAFPLGAALALMALATMLAVVGLRPRQRADTQLAGPSIEEEDIAEGDEQSTDWKRSPVTVIALTVTAVLIMPHVGFFVSTSILMLVVFALLGVPRWPARIVIMATFFLFTYGLFINLLSVNLPTGPWGF